MTCSRHLLKSTHRGQNLAENSSTISFPAEPFSRVRVLSPVLILKTLCLPRSCLLKPGRVSEYSSTRLSTSLSAYFKHFTPISRTSSYHGASPSVPLRAPLCKPRWCAIVFFILSTFKKNQWSRILHLYAREQVLMYCTVVLLRGF